MGIYLWFKIYFLIDTNAKMWTEITDIVIFRKKLLKFRQGVQSQSDKIAFVGPNHLQKFWRKKPKAITKVTLRATKNNPISFLFILAKTLFEAKP